MHALTQDRHEQEELKALTTSGVVFIEAKVHRAPVIFEQFE